MSRTYRKHSHRWIWRNPLEEVVEGWEPGNEMCQWCRYDGQVCSWKKIDPKSEQGRKILAMSRRDKTYRFKDPGPSWFRNMFEERPHRRFSKREIQKFMLDENYEPLVNAKSRKRVYWT